MLLSDKVFNNISTCHYIPNVSNTNHISQHINWICHAVLLSGFALNLSLIYIVCAVFHRIGSGSLVLIYHVLSAHILHTATNVDFQRGRRKNSKHTLLSLNECVWHGFVESSQASFFSLRTGYRV